MILENSEIGNELLQRNQMGSQFISVTDHISEGVADKPISYLRVDTHAEPFYKQKQQHYKTAFIFHVLTQTSWEKK